MKILVTYLSKYGHTKKFAEWIAKELGVSAYDSKNLDSNLIKNADLIIFGSGIYAGGFKIHEDLKNLNDKKLIFFITGASNPKETNYSEIYEKSIPNDLMNKVKIFHIQTGINYKKLSLTHKLMMKMIRGSFEKELEKNYSEELKYSLDHYFDEYDFSKKEDIADLIAYVKNLKH